MIEKPYALYLYDEDDKDVARAVPSPFIPAPGTIVLTAQEGGNCWEVTSPAQVLFPDRGSEAALRGSPLMVQLRVKPGKGIHDA